MKIAINVRAASFAALLLLCVINAYTQVKSGGEVVEIIDGKTVVVAIPNGRVKVELSYIEVPLPGEPLHATVKEHLGKLLLGKVVELYPVGIAPGKTTGKLFQGGIDVSRQMLRDGAAWHIPINESGQDKAEHSQYAELEGLARTEKRGVWSAEGLKPPWELRNDKAVTGNSASHTYDASPESSSSQQSKYRKNYRYSNINEDMWTEVGGGHLSQKMAIDGGLFSGYDYSKKFANISTKGITQILSDGKRKIEVEIRFVYFHRDIKLGRENRAYVAGLYCKSKEHNFAAGGALVFVADGRKVDFGAGSRFWRESNDSVEELIQYKVTRDKYSAVAAAKQVEIRVGAFSGRIPVDSLVYLRNLVAISEKKADGSIALE